MTQFYIYKDKVMKFYKNYEAYFEIAFKFVIAFLVFGYINKSLGDFQMLNNIGVKLVLSLLSAIVPSSIFVLLASVAILMHLYKLSLIMMVFALVAFIIFYFLYLKFAPEHGVLMLVIPVLAPLNLHYMIPLIAGLFFTPFTAVPIGISFVMVKFVHYIKEAVPMLGEKLDVEEIVASLQYVIDHVLADKEMLLFAIAFILTIAVTYFISRLPFDYSWYIGIALGAVCCIVVMFMGSGMMSVDISGAGVIFGTLISALIVAVVQFMRCALDYRRKEVVQFEDDDYFYYVKAVPKMIDPDRGFGVDEDAEDYTAPEEDYEKPTVVEAIMRGKAAITKHRSAKKQNNTRKTPVYTKRERPQEVPAPVEPVVEDDYEDYNVYDDIHYFEQLEQPKKAGSRVKSQNQPKAQSQPKAAPQRKASYSRFAGDFEDMDLPEISESYDEIPYDDFDE